MFPSMLRSAVCSPCFRFVDWNFCDDFSFLPFSSVLHTVYWFRPWSVLSNLSSVYFVLLHSAVPLSHIATFDPVLLCCCLHMTIGRKCAVQLRLRGAVLAVAACNIVRFCSNKYFIYCLRIHLSTFVFIHFNFIWVQQTTMLSLRWPSRCFFQVSGHCLAAGTPRDVKLFLVTFFLNYFLSRIFRVDRGDTLSFRPFWMWVDVVNSNPPGWQKFIRSTQIAGVCKLLASFWTSERGGGSDETPLGEIRVLFLYRTHI